MKKVLLLSVCLIVSVLFGGARLCAQSSPSVTFSTSDDDKTLTISGQGDLTNYMESSKRFSELLSSKISSGSYSTVKFVNTGSDALIIDAEIVRSIFYWKEDYQEKVNSTIETLDLGATTVNDLNSTLFYYEGSSSNAWKLIN